MKPIIHHLEYINGEYREYKEDLLKRLLDHVFHLTTKQAFEQIKFDGFVFHNQGKRFNLNTSSENSSGRKRACVCLFDLRNKNNEDIEFTLERYNFYGPEWFCGDDLAYLILDSSCYDKIVSNEEVKKICIATNESEHYIPKTECWYPGNLPLACIREAFIVKIFQDRPNHDPFLHSLNQIAFKNRNKAKSQ